MVGYGYVVYFDHGNSSNRITFRWSIDIIDYVGYVVYNIYGWRKEVFALTPILSVWECASGLIVLRWLNSALLPNHSPPLVPVPSV